MLMVMLYAGQVGGGGGLSFVLFFDANLLWLSMRIFMWLDRGEHNRLNIHCLGSAKVCDDVLELIEIINDMSCKYRNFRNCRNLFVKISRIEWVWWCFRSLREANRKLKVQLVVNWNRQGWGFVISHEADGSITSVNGTMTVDGWAICRRQPIQQFIFFLFFGTEDVQYSTVHNRSERCPIGWQRRPTFLLRSPCLPPLAIPATQLVICAKGWCSRTMAFFANSASALPDLNASTLSLNTTVRTIRHQP